MATTTSTGSTISTPLASAALEVAPDGVDLVLLEQALADLVALGLEEREDHAAADQQPVDRAEQVVDDAELVRDLGAAEHDDVRPLGVAGEPAQHLGLDLDQLAGRVRQPPGHVVDAGVLAVHGTEAVTDVDVGESGELVGEGAALRVVLALLARVEAQVLEQRDVAVAEPVDGRPGAVADRVGRELDRPAEHLGQPLGDRGEAVLLHRLALGPAQVRAHDHAGAAVGEVGDRRRAGPDPAVVGDRAAVQRHVEVRADEDPLAAEVSEVVDSLHGAGQSDEPTSDTRSTRRLE